jgi:hypothetical protein
VRLYEARPWWPLSAFSLFAALRAKRYYFTEALYRILIQHFIFGLSGCIPRPRDRNAGAIDGRVPRALG